MPANIPDALAMRNLKYSGGTDSAKDAVAKALREADRRSEAILLYDDRPDDPSLQEEREWAVGGGIAFHLLALGRLGVQIREQDWKACAEAAEKAGRWMDARQCFVVLQDGEALARIAAHLPPSLRPEVVEETDEA